jgi:hypothetical protein
VAAVSDRELPSSQPSQCPAFFAGTLLNLATL